MESKLFNEKSKNGIRLSSNYHNSKRINKFRSIYDSLTDNTIVMLDIQRATVYEAEEFYNYVHELLEDNNNRIIIDMDGVYFIDSVFFGTLIKLLKQATKSGGHIKLIVDYNSKPELLSISNFEGIFELYPNLFEALNRAKAS
jgi:anti-anti-sigma factor